MSISAYFLHFLKDISQRWAEFNTVGTLFAAQLKWYTNYELTVEASILPIVMKVGHMKVSILSTVMKVGKDVLTTAWSLVEPESLIILGLKK